MTIYVLLIIGIVFIAYIANKKPPTGHIDRWESRVRLMKEIGVDPEEFAAWQKTRRLMKEKAHARRRAAQVEDRKLR